MDDHGSGKRKKDDERSESSTSPISKKKKDSIFDGPSFYKIIVAPSTQEHTLRIPEDYAKTYYEDQFAKGYVKVKVGDNNNNNRIWEIEVFKEENSGKVFLKKGWEKVMESYSIEYGDFLLFTYDEDECVFDVSIFYASGCEIKYDQVFKDCMEVSPEDKAMNGDGNDNDDRKDGDVVTPLTPKVELEWCIALEEKTQVQNLVEVETPRFEVVMQPRNVFTNTNKYPKLIWSCYDERRSTNNLITTSSYTNMLKQAIPMYHAKIYFKEDNKRRQDVILKGASDKKSYNATVYLQFERSRAELYGNGWRDFTIDNELKVEDECVFEMINPPCSYIYKVTISRRTLLPTYLCGSTHRVNYPVKDEVFPLSDYLTS